MILLPQANLLLGRNFRILGPDGETFHNGLTTVGLNNMLDVYFHGATQITTWYFGLIDNASFSALAAGDSMSSHAGWIENVDYSESVRQTWVEGAPSGGAITGSAATFTLNASVTLRGVFLTSVNTKSGTTGILWATGLFAAARAYVSGSTFQVTYSDLHA